MPKRDFHVFVRQHENDAFTVSSLTHPEYAAYATALTPARDELSRVLAGELALGAIGDAEETTIGDFTRRVVEVKVRAVQHDRLLEMPLRVTALCHRTDDALDVWQVWLPRLERRFTIRGRDAIEPWTEEVVKGRFHLAPVDEVRAHEHDRGERVDRLEVGWRPIDGRRLEKERGAQDEPRPPLDEVDRDAPEEDRVLDGMGTDLSAQAKNGELARCHLRDDVIARLERILAPRHGALLVGPSGTGKTAIVHELAHRAVERGGRRVWHAPPSRLMAGAIFLGQWQQRALEALREARAAGVVLYLGELGALIAATERRADSGMTLPRMIEPFVRARELAVVVEASADAVSRAEAVEPGFVDALRRLPLPPLGPGAAYEVLGRRAARIAADRRMQVEPEGLTRALDLVARFGDAAGLPGTGLALLEQMAAVAERADARAVTKEHAIRAFVEQTGYPRDLVDTDRPLDADDVRAHLDERVRGQRIATQRLADVVAVLKAGLNDPERPLASLLFMGPTGVGKTESALSLAEYLFGDRKRLVRLDMSEYAQPWSASRLIDGVGGEGDLTGPVRRQPFGIVLLDEIEKGAPEVFDVLLSVLGEGRLTDGTGRTVRFGHTIVVLTSNLGASDKGPLGIRARSDATGPDYLGAATRFFRPELMNRIDHVVPFAPLDRETLRQIARRLLDAALAREGLSRRGVAVEADESVVDHLAEVGFDPALGARPMKRAVDARVIVPLAAALAAAPSPPSKLRLTVKDDALVITPA